MILRTLDDQSWRKWPGQLCARTPGRQARNWDPGYIRICDLGWPLPCPEPQLPHLLNKGWVHVWLKHSSQGCLEIGGVLPGWHTVKWAQERWRPSRSQDKPHPAHGACVARSATCSSGPVLDTKPFHSYKDHLQWRAPKFPFLWGSPLEGEAICHDLPKPHTT